MDIRTIYDNYLYDCYILNQRLTDDDWLFYGKELHHLDIPDCEGGTLTATNSQYLTTYQHWVAGVLQSEVAGRVCFAFVPKNVLPDWVEKLRVKWLNKCAEHARKNAPGFPPELQAKIRAIRKRKRTLRKESYAHQVPYTKRKVNSRSKTESKRRGTPIIIITPDGTRHYYEGIKLACRHHGLHPAHIREVAQGKRASHKGHRAEFPPQ